MVTVVSMEFDPNKRENTGTHYRKVIADVELLIPFTFAGKDLSTVVSARIDEYTTQVVWNDSHLEVVRSKFLASALEDAIDAAEADIYAKLMEARPTARAKRLKKKTQAVLKQLHNS
jgi:hypothetical protein